MILLPNGLRRLRRNDRDEAAATNAAASEVGLDNGRFQPPSK